MTAKATTPRKTPHRAWYEPEIRWARSLAPLVILGLAVHLLLPQIASFEQSAQILRSMPVWLVGLAGAAQVCSYLGSGYLLKVIIDMGRPRVSVWRDTLITLAAASIGLVAGGWVGAAAATYRWVEKSEDSSEEAALAGVLPLLFNNALLLAVTIFGLGYLLINHNLTQAQVIVYSLFLAALLAVIGAVIYAMRHQAPVERLADKLAEGLGGILHRLKVQQDFNPDVIRVPLNNLYCGLELLGEKGWLRPVTGSALNIGFDMLTLYCLFLAAGYAAPPGVLMAGYGLAFLLGKAAFLFPGGVGVVESGMTAIFTNLGVPASVSVVVILSYRLFSFWIPSLLGFGVAAGMNTSRGLAN